jgi:hypothetical protein
VQESAPARHTDHEKTNAEEAREKRLAPDGYESGRHQDDDDGAYQPGGAPEKAKMPQAGLPQILGNASYVF